MDAMTQNADSFDPTARFSEADSLIFYSAMNETYDYDPVAYYNEYAQDYGDNKMEISFPEVKFKYNIFQIYSIYNFNIF